MALAVVSVCRAQEVTTETVLSQYLTIYEQNLAQIGKRYDEKLAEWPKLYVRELAAIQKRAQTAGDLEAWMAIQSELERFERDREVRAPNLVATPDLLREIQSRYQDSDTKLLAARNSETTALNDKYVSALGRLQSGLTKAGKIPEALKVNEEIRRVQGTGTASAEPEPPVLLTDPDAAAPTGAGADPDPLPAPSLVRTEAGPFTVFSGGVPPPIPGVALKPVQLYLAASSGESQSIAVGAELGFAPPGAGNSIAPGGSGTYHLRVSVRPASAASTLNLSDPRILVQYYARESSDRDSGRFMRACEDLAAIPSISQDGAVIECPAVNLSAPRTDTGLTGAAPAAQELYGVVISIFSGEGRAVFQASSVPALSRIVSPGYPKNAAEIVARRAYENARERYYEARSERTKSMSDPAKETAMEEARRVYIEAQKAYFAAREAGGG